MRVEILVHLEVLAVPQSVTWARKREISNARFHEALAWLEAHGSDAA